jgi:hypothetical protein
LHHATITLQLGNNLSSTFNDDLAGLECSHSAHTIATVDSLHDLDTKVVAVAFASTLERFSHCFAVSVQFRSSHS